ncbi:hypothetical protein CTAYLR_006527 [Chrysophaeum taylorii]|uniref:DUF676 domain-containing protein n=1 Tax=Chrysophaeum taylorii TaxID=2483200 RepID=A0AAD7UGV6_9STRA|nr:hypothetical protein CTAYLR_006527 [Chrysophaeum taylorii]
MDTEFFPGENDGSKDRVLVVVAGGLQRTKEQMHDIRDTLRNEIKLSEYHKADVQLFAFSPYECWNLRNLKIIGKAFQMEEANHFVADILYYIEKRWEEVKYDRIVFVGHSMGTVFIRKAYVAATGLFRKYKFEESIYDHLEARLGRDPNMTHWLPKVERIVMLSGLLRGWNLDEFGLNWSFVTLARLAKPIAFLIEPRPLISQLEYTEKFPARLRLQWIELPELKKDLPTVIQLLGTKDEFVAPESCIDPC